MNYSEDYIISILDDISVVRQLILYGFNPDDIIKYAVFNEYVPTIRYLLSYGADPDDALVCVLSDRVDIVKLCIEYGADVYRYNRRYFPLERFRMYKFKNIVQFILENNDEHLNPSLEYEYFFD